MGFPGYIDHSAGIAITRHRPSARFPWQLSEPQQATENGSDASQNCQVEPNSDCQKTNGATYSFSDSEPTTHELRSSEDTPLRPLFVLTPTSNVKCLEATDGRRRVQSHPLVTAYVTPDHMTVLPTSPLLHGSRPLRCPRLVVPNSGFQNAAPSGISAIIVSAESLPYD